MVELTTGTVAVAVSVPGGCAVSATWSMRASIVARSVGLLDAAVDLFVASVASVAWSAVAIMFSAFTTCVRSPGTASRRIDLHGDNMSQRRYLLYVNPSRITFDVMCRFSAASSSDSTIEFRSKCV